MGDFNTPDVVWSTLSASSRFSSKICDLIIQHNYTQIVEYSTHVQGNIGSHNYYNCDENISSLQIHTEDNLLFKSDHYL